MWQEIEDQLEETFGGGQVGEIPEEDYEWDRSTENEGNKRTTLTQFRVRLPTEGDNVLTGGITTTDGDQTATGTFSEERTRNIKNCPSPKKAHYH